MAQDTARGSVPGHDRHHGG